MEADKCISTSSAATSTNQLTINDLDMYSLGMIFNKLPYVDRTRVEDVCQRWYTASEASWCIYSKRLIIDWSSLSSCNDVTKKKNILEKILQRCGPYLEEIICTPDFDTGQWIKIKWIVEFCPKLKRLNTGHLMLEDDDWLACSNLEALSFFAFMEEKGDEMSEMFRRNKKLRRLEIFGECLLTASDFDDLDPGQLELLHIEYCRDFELTLEVADKLAESLVELNFCVSDTSNYEHLGKLKNLRSLDLNLGATELPSFETEIIADIAQNCRKLERLFLAFQSRHPDNQNVFEPLFDLPNLRRLVIIVREEEIPCEERDKLTQRGSHLEFILIDKICLQCIYAV